MDLRRHKVKKQIIKATILNFKSSTLTQKKNPPTLLWIAIYSIIVQLQVGSFASAGDPTWDSFHPYQREIGAGTSTYTDTNKSFFLKKLKKN
jgi:hypothetical protein